jgi:2-dehydro-3-deoxyphosphogluconate aldolase/(4S)-4-hydroxy-2-oxoglutarate aldolase
MNPADATAQQLLRAGLIAVIRGDFSLAEQRHLAEALLEGGVRALELTLNSREALAGVAQLKEAFGGELLVGAGTVRTPAEVEGALRAGAQFLLAPNLDLEVLAAARAAGALLLPGVFTATEAQTAYRAGCRLVKLFPADALGPTYLKALRAPLHDIGFVPTGGITPDTLGAFYRAGAVAFGVGSYLVRNVAVTAAERRALKTRAAALGAALAAARGG